MRLLWPQRAPRVRGDLAQAEEVCASIPLQIMYGSSLLARTRTHLHAFEKWVYFSAYCARQASHVSGTNMRPIHALMHTGQGLYTGATAQRASYGHALERLLTPLPLRILFSHSPKGNPISRPRACGAGRCGWTGALPRGGFQAERPCLQPLLLFHQWRLWPHRRSLAPQSPLWKEGAPRAAMAL